jgi:hypothetical protein
MEDTSLRTLGSMKEEYTSKETNGRALVMWMMCNLVLSLVEMGPEISLEARAASLVTCLI